MMTGSHTSAPAWLFSFVDLAFLLLIAMTQLARPADVSTLRLGEIEVPRIGGEAASPLPVAAPRLWQLRVHPSEEGVSPFELAVPGAAGERLPVAELRQRLDLLKRASAPAPLLAPHADSRSQDLLDAVALVSEIWPDARGATVERLAQP